MQQLKFTNNPNGKLLLDVFGDIRLANAEKFSAGSLLEIYLRNQLMGIAEVIGYKEFSFQRITDCIAHMNCGKGAAYQAKMLNIYYPEHAPLRPEATMMHVVFRWKKRNLPYQAELMKEWWNNKLEQEPYITNTENLFL